MTLQTILRPAEWVLPGHPDKLADAVADTLVQAAAAREATVGRDRRLPMALGAGNDRRCRVGGTRALGAVGSRFRREDYGTVTRFTATAWGARVALPFIGPLLHLVMPGASCSRAVARIGWTFMGMRHAQKGTTMPPADWFRELTGFRELPYESTRARLALKDGRLLSLENEQSYGIGNLELLSVGELRSRALSMAEPVAGRLKVSKVSGDVREMHRDPDNQGALFQVASQFNLLEMVRSCVTPEHGVTRYAEDGTQGPACAIAGGAATIYRNYFVPVDGEPGQTATRQLDGLKDLGEAFGNEGSRLWKMSNGYALCTSKGLAEIARRVEGAGAAQVDMWRDLLRIGVHWDVEVTDRTKAPRPTVSQAFCSALPVANGDAPKEHWRVFATLVLEGLYEATLWAAVINAARGASSKVLLTRVGGGAFGNDHA